MTSTSTGTATPQLTEAELRALVERFHQEPHSARLLVVDADPEWDGPEVLDTDHGPVRIVRGTTVLAVRVAMVDHRDEKLVVLTRRSMHELGTEVAAQSWRGRVERPSPWNAVLALFRASQIDPKLRAQEWMIELLVRRAPANRGYPQPIGGVLTIEVAWETLYRTLLGLPATSPSVDDLVRWVASEQAGPALALLDERARRELAARLSWQAGPAAPRLLTLAEGQHDTDAVTLGLVVDALWPAPDPVAKALLESRYLGEEELSDAAAVDWGAAARRLALLSADRGDDGELQLLVQRTEELLRSIKGTPHADSDLLPSGLTNGVREVVVALRDGLDGAGDAVSRAEAGVAKLERHRDAGRDRIELCRAAVRLLRRGAPDGQGDDLDAATWRYLDDGAWVDAARQRLAVGDADPDLADVAHRLIERIDEERRRRDRTFAAAVAAQATAKAPEPSLAHRRPLRIEQVLDTVVAPLARQVPVLVLVLDGLSHAAAVPLRQDLRREGWMSHGPDGQRLPPALAALPSITRVSRTSLLTGRLAVGGQDVEREGFTTHPALVEATAGGPPPELFHKKELRTTDGQVAPAARDALADPSRRVAGVVFNGVDDFLGDLDQLRLVDGLEGLPPLGDVLGAAMQGGRAVVLTSDHGHVLGASRVVSGSGGERYRLPDDRALDDGEVELSGDRVLEGDERIVAAADHDIRYYAAAKRGYHGGATPAEMLCPLVVLLPGSVALDGWLPAPQASPGWWDPSDPDEEIDAQAVASPAAAVASSASAWVPEPEPSPQPGLFDEVSPVPAAGRGDDWVVALLASPRLAAQRKLAGRTAVDDEVLASVLRLLVAAGGTASGAVLQRGLKVAPMRLRGVLNGVRSLLDVEGYQVLRVETDGTAQLDLRRLAEQFEVDVPDAGGGA